jgi:hypothetical protein
MKKSVLLALSSFLLALLSVCGFMFLLGGFAGSFPTFQDPNPSKLTTWAMMVAGAGRLCRCRIFLLPNWPRFHTTIEGVREMTISKSKRARDPFQVKAIAENTVTPIKAATRAVSTAVAIAPARTASAAPGGCATPQAVCIVPLWDRRS